MKKIIITISILILIALGFIGYKTDIFGTKSINKDTSVIVKDYLNTMMIYNNDAVIVSIPIMNNLEIKESKVRVLAANVVDNQSFDISKMKNIYNQYLGPVPEIATSSENIFTDLKDIKGEELGEEYVKDVIEHYKKSIKISEKFIKQIDQYKKYNSVKQGGLVITSSHPAIDESYDFAKNIIEAYKKELDSLKEIY